MMKSEFCSALKRDCALILVSGFLFLGCDKGSDFLQKPPAPVINSKTDVTTTTTTTMTTTTSTTTSTTTTMPLVSTVYKLEQSNFETRGTDVDIVWVIDNSSSMGDVQQKVIQNTDAFIKSFVTDSRLHWKMGLISTSVDDQPYVGFGPSDALDWKTADAVTKFQSAVGRLGVGGDGTEKTFDPFVKQINSHPDFLRPNAFLALIMVTDVSEQSYTYNPTSFLTYLTGLKGGHKEKILTYGVIPADGSTCGEDYGAPIYGYPDLITATNGKRYDLCAADFGPGLAALGADLVNHLTVLNPIIAVEQAIDLKSLVIRHKGVVLKQGFLSEGGQWIYDVETNTIRILDSSLLDATDPYFTLTYRVISGS
jgi:hypothetical protein